MGKNIQIVKLVDKNDKAVIQARQIAEKVKILSYPETEKLLDRKASDFSLARAKV